MIDLDILEREVPIAEENPEKSKKGLYTIKDNYLQFWFAFVYPNMSFIKSGHSCIVMNKIRNNLVKITLPLSTKMSAKNGCGS